MYLLSDFLDDATRVARSDDVGGDVVGHDRAGAYGHVVANGHAGQDGHVAPNPHIVADGDGLAPLAARVALHRVSAVARRVDAHIGTHKAIVADGHPGLVEHREVEVGKEALAHADVAAVIAVERLVDQDVVIAHVSQQRLEHRRAFGAHGRQQLVIAVNHILARIQFPEQLGIGRRIHLPGQQFLFLSHNSQFFLQKYAEKSTWTMPSRGNWTMIRS